MGMLYSEPMSRTAMEDPPRHRYTVVDYHRMGEVGILAPDARVELIDGEIIDMAPPGDPHAGTVDQLALIFGSAVAGDRPLGPVVGPRSPAGLLLLTDDPGAGLRPFITVPAPQFVQYTLVSSTATP